MSCGRVSRRVLFFSWLYSIIRKYFVRIAWRLKVAHFKLYELLLRRMYWLHVCLLCIIFLFTFLEYSDLSLTHSKRTYLKVYARNNEYFARFSKLKLKNSKLLPSEKIHKNVHILFIVMYLYLKVQEKRNHENEKNNNISNSIN